MHSALDDITFLAGSENRIDVLAALTDGPKVQHDLRELTGASRMTVHRILDDLQARGWVSEDGGRFEATPEGAFAAREFDRFRANMEAARHLEGVLGDLPTDLFDGNLACLRDARIDRYTTWGEYTDSVGHVVDLVGGASQVRGTASGFSHAVMETVDDATAAGDLTLELVVDDDALGMVRSDDTLGRHFADLLTCEHVTIHHYRGDEPLLMLLVVDGTTSMCPHGDGGPPPCSIESENATFRALAGAYFERFRAEARPLDGEAFAAVGAVDAD